MTVFILLLVAAVLLFLASVVFLVIGAINLTPDDKGNKANEEQNDKSSQNK